MMPPPPPHCAGLRPRCCWAGGSAPRRWTSSAMGVSRHGWGFGDPLGSGGVGAVASGGPDASLCGAARQPRCRHVLGGRPALRATRACHRPHSLTPLHSLAPLHLLAPLHSLTPSHPLTAGYPPPTPPRSAAVGDCDRGAAAARPDAHAGRAGRVPAGEGGGLGAALRAGRWWSGASSQRLRCRRCSSLLLLLLVWAGIQGAG
jgi:hypothetical protein